MEKMRVGQFTGGMTDYYIDGPDHAAQTMENLLVTRDGKLIVRPGSEVLDSTHYKTTSEDTRIGKIFEYNDLIFIIQSGALFYYEEGTGWTEVQGPGGESLFFSADDQTNYSVVRWNMHFIITTDELAAPPVKVYKDQTSGLWWGVRCGLPALTTTPAHFNISVSINNSINYIYYLVVRRWYRTPDLVEFEDVGPPLMIPVTGGPDMTVANQIQLTANDFTLGWGAPFSYGKAFYDDSMLEVRVYRTTGNGTVAKYVGSQGANFLAFGDSFTDTVLDEDLGEELYIEGDVLEYDPAPGAKYLAYANDITWYANLQENSDWEGTPSIKPQRVRQSLQNAPDKCPASLYIDLDAPITGMSSIGNYPIVFTEDKCYRLEGYVDSLGSGFTKKILIADTVGCISNDSIVQSQNGLCFASKRGFYFTDGFKVMLVSGNLVKDTYPRWTGDAGRHPYISGAYDAVNNRYSWTVINTEEESYRPDAIAVYDANFGIKEDGCFTLLTTDLSVGEYGYYGFASAHTYVGGVMYRALAGAVFKHTVTMFTDPVFPVTFDPGNPLAPGEVDAPSTWTTIAVPYDYTSCSFSMGVEDTTKLVPRITLTAANESDLSLLVQSANDNSGVWSDLNPVKFRGSLVWGNDELIWGDTDFVWNYLGSIIVERRMPRGQLRCLKKQVRFTNSMAQLFKSDDYATATISTTDDTLTVDSGEWPEDVDHYSVYFSWDNYTEGFPITSRTDTVLTLTDTNGTLRNGSWAWEIRGHRKNERFHLQSYLLEYELFGNKLLGSGHPEGGGNA